MNVQLKVFDKNIVNQIEINMNVHLPEGCFNAKVFEKIKNKKKTRMEILPHQKDDEKMHSQWMWRFKEG